ncbi:MAG: hypothetical protein M1820_007177 [Bogoriella megaspora]|nr:MAG: hypothetical protein M1820_007177 [Bogoriella megaspora]
MLKYFSQKKTEKSPANEVDQAAQQQDHESLEGAQRPVLKDEDERFLEKVTSEGHSHENPEQPSPVLEDGQVLKDATAENASQETAETRISDPTNKAFGDSQDKVENVNTEEGEEEQPPELPKRPRSPKFPSQAEAEAATSPGTQNQDSINEGLRTTDQKKSPNYWSYVPKMPNMPAVPTMPNMQLPNMSGSTMFHDRSREQMANSLQSAAEAFKAGEGVPLNPDGTLNQEEATKQQANDLSHVLKNLNLSAINNRVFSLSSESQELLERFNLVLRDLINGGPTAYHDLETLLDERSKQLSEMWGQLPPFVQTLVKTLPAKIGSSFGPELFAAAAEKPDAKVEVTAETKRKAPGVDRKAKKSAMPSVKSLVTEKGTVAQMLRSILNFLKVRFPAFMSGTNILMSLAVFILLFVFWYCHKRGRETRLASSSLENSTASLDDSNVPEKGSPTSDTEPEPNNDVHEDPIEESLIDAAVAEAKAEAPTEVDQHLDDVLSQPAPKDVGLPESPSETRDYPAINNADPTNPTDNPTGS